MSRYLTEQKHAFGRELSAMSNRGGDVFGFCFGGPNLNGKTVSVRSEGSKFAMLVPAFVLAEMRQDAEDPATTYRVSEHGLVSFDSEGPFGEIAIKRAAALLRALPDTPLARFREKTETMPATAVERMAPAGWSGYLPSLP